MPKNGRRDDVPNQTPYRIPSWLFLIFAPTVLPKKLPPVQIKEEQEEKQIQETGEDSLSLKHTVLKPFFFCNQGVGCCFFVFGLPNPYIVDEDVQPISKDLGCVPCQLLATLPGRHVRRDVMGTTDLRGGLPTGLLRPRREQDVRTGRHEALGDHQADPP
jgi:hypothetical protein